MVRNVSRRYYVSTLRFNLFWQSLDNVEGVSGQVCMLIDCFAFEEYSNAENAMVTDEAS